MATYRSPEPTPSSVGLRVEGHRLAKGWTKEDLTTESGVDRRQIARIEAGEVDPKLSTLVRLARAFGVHVTELLADTGVFALVVRDGERRPRPLVGEALEAERAAAAGRARHGTRWRAGGKR